MARLGSSASISAELDATKEVKKFRVATENLVCCFASSSHFEN
jgi:hypothetical protein